jgi:hypothetical protein
VVPADFAGCGRRQITRFRLERFRLARVYNDSAGNVAATDMREMQLGFETGFLGVVKEIRTGSAGAILSGELAWSGRGLN